MMGELFRRWVVMWWIGLAVLVSATAWFWTGAPHENTPPEPLASLSSLGADISQTTVSGISSGAYMAGQFQIAHSKIVTGAAIIAGGPYGCAQSVFSGAAPDAGVVFLGASRAINGCMQNNLTMWGIPNPERLAQKATALAKENKIDPIEDVITDKVYLFSGSKDSTVVPAIVVAAKEFYLKLGVPPINIEFKADLGAGHGFVTEAKGGSCSASSRPFIVDCDYDQAGAILKHLYGTLSPAADMPMGSFQKFNQLELASDERTHGLAKTGVVYVPRACENEPGCRVHVAFHGCNQNRASVGEAFSKDSGFDIWADTNRIIVLFPQVSTSTLNPTGCWDWWGYTGQDYLTRDAPQISAIRSMLGRLEQSSTVRPSS